ELDGVPLSEQRYQITANNLTIDDLPECFELTTQVLIDPKSNQALEGLYKSGPIFCTQNEPEGFRKITYYLDRSDVMAKFSTKIIADQKLYPTLLSNGNLVEQGVLEDGQHWARWEDPFPKPSYLYALVAGKLDQLSDKFITTSGREIDLRIYCDPGNIEKCHHAMQSLKRSMAWDEEQFGREYDLDIYMIVAVDSFNMGAMENKGLNIFNSAYVMADQKSATDNDFMGIEGVVGHEYFHNWTGNRITCRDWFQLTLKEGLTVFRDQQFSGQMNSTVVQRINDVRRLKRAQFPEDAGPTAHPIKPKSFIEINNFYTATIYEKGAEVIRMLHTFVGAKRFRRGMDRYFELFDGQAVCTEDFTMAISEGARWELEHFERWYDQTGTPTVKVTLTHNPETASVQLTIKQTLPDTPEGKKQEQPLFFPFKIGLIATDGSEYPLVIPTSNAEQPQLNRGIIYIRQLEEQFNLTGIKERPTLSLNRGFSAPVKVEYEYSDQEIYRLMTSDSDSFNQWEAAEQAAKRIILSYVQGGQEKLVVPPEYLDAYRTIILNNKLDMAIKAYTLTIPGSDILLADQNPIDIDRTISGRDQLQRVISLELQTEMLKLYQELSTNQEFSLTPLSVGRRALKNLLLGQLVAAEDPAMLQLAFEQFSSATNMTDQFYGMTLLTQFSGQLTNQAINQFLAQWKDETLVVQKWFGAQALSAAAGTLDRVIELEKMELFDIKVPNLLRALVGSFAANVRHFHARDGSGYHYLADKIIEIDALNPSMASALIGRFKWYKKLDSIRQKAIKTELLRIKKRPLSNNAYEIIDKILTC
ncbi:MAG: aminopeptidase N, partial [Bdellovibrionales bacterium]|nr:aminopeptidase N [Bdellovibrionales bacterium]